MNNVGIEIRSKLRDYFIRVDTLESEEEKQEAIQTLVPIIKRIKEKHEASDDDDSDVGI